MWRIIVFIIVIYIVAKIAGAILHFVRFMMISQQPKRTPQPKAARDSKKMPYSNVEDVDYEDITDKP